MRRMPEKLFYGNINHNEKQFTDKNGLKQERQQGGVMYTPPCVLLALSAK